MTNQDLHEAELLPPLKESELPMLRLSTPLQTLKEYFDKMAATQERALTWAENCVIDSPASRDEARNERKALQAFAKAVDETRLQIKQPVEDYLTEFKVICDEVIERAKKGVAIYDAKGVAYAQECTRRENEEKAKALAARRAEEERIAAERRQREAEEEKTRLQEAERIAKIRKQAEAEAKNAKDKMTAKLQADEAAKAEEARIGAERAARDKAEADRKAQEERELHEANAKAANELAKATGHGKTKGVKTDWVIEIVDERAIPEQFKTYDSSKAKAYLKAGLSAESHELKIIPGLRCYTTVKSSGR